MNEEYYLELFEEIKEAIKQEKSDLYDYVKDYELGFLEDQSNWGELAFDLNPPMVLVNKELHDEVPEIDLYDTIIHELSHAIDLGLNGDRLDADWHDSEFHRIYKELYYDVLEVIYIIED